MRYRAKSDLHLLRLSALLLFLVAGLTRAADPPLKFAAPAAGPAIPPRPAAQATDTKPSKPEITVAFPLQHIDGAKIRERIEDLLGSHRPKSKIGESLIVIANKETIEVVSDVVKVLDVAKEAGRIEPVFRSAGVPGTAPRPDQPVPRPLRDDDDSFRPPDNVKVTPRSKVQMEKGIATEVVPAAGTTSTSFGDAVTTAINDELERLNRDGETLRKVHTFLENRIVEILKGFPEPAAPNALDPETIKAKEAAVAELTRVVRDLFRNRQKLQRNELQAFSARIRKMQKALDDRESLAEEIIKQRVQELAANPIPDRAAQSEPEDDEGFAPQAKPGHVPTRTEIGDDPIDRSQAPPNLDKVRGQGPQPADKTNLAPRSFRDRIKESPANSIGLGADPLEGSFSPLLDDRLNRVRPPKDVGPREPRIPLPPTDKLVPSQPGTELRDDESDLLKPKEAPPKPVIDATPPKTPLLEGVWESNPALVAGKSGVRIVFQGDRAAKFNASQRTASWRFTVDTTRQPNRIHLSECEGSDGSQRGIFEIREQGTRLRLSIAPTDNAFPAKFAVDFPEWKFVSREIPADLAKQMEQIPAPKATAPESLSPQSDPAKAKSAEIPPKE